VLCLLSNKVFGSAFALVRPLIEATGRAYVVIMGSEEDVRKLRNDEYRMNFGTVGKQIDAFFGTGDWFESFLNRAKNAFHSYTHAGLSQLGRRFSGNDVRPSYSEEELIEVIETSTIAAFLVTKLITKHFERTRARRRMRRKGTLGTSMTPARRMVWPRSSSRQRRRFSAKGRLTR